MTLFYVANRSLPIGSTVWRYQLLASRPRLLDVMAKALVAGPQAVLSLLLADLWLEGRGMVDISAVQILIEVVFEYVRQQVAPDAPSRLKSAFLFSTLEDAHRFRERYRPNGAIHACRFVEGTTFTADMALTNPGINFARPIEAELQEMQERARAYWTAKQPMEWPEVLLDGSAVIEELVDQPATSG